MVTSPTIIIVLPEFYLVALVALIPHPSAQHFGRPSGIMPHFSERCHIGQGIVLPGLNMVARAGLWGTKCDPVGGLL